jgi:hypothetical protein
MRLRQTVSNLMVRIHRIPPELARSHVQRMDDSEVKRRFRNYQRLVVAGKDPHEHGRPKRQTIA